MKNKHFITFLLIMLTTVAFVSYFFVEYKYQIYCTKATFVLSTLAAVIECYFARRSDKKLKELRYSLTWG